MSILPASPSRQAAHWKGLWAEKRALWFMRLYGYRLLAHRLKTPVGEIDLLMRRGSMLVVVEVKARSTLYAGLEAVPPKAQRRLTKALQFFLTQRPQYACYDVRFDLIVVRPWCLPAHFSNVIS